MTDTVARVVPRPLTEEAWEPFGWLPVSDEDPADGTHRLEFAWQDVHVNVIGHTLSEVERAGPALRARAMYRHDTHTQTLMPLDHLAVIAVAPADVAMADASDLEAVEAFLLEPLQPLVLHRGTWHWGPYPVEEEEVRLFNVQGLRYREDNRCADLGSMGLGIDVVVAGLDGAGPGRTATGTGSPGHV